MSVIVAIQFECSTHEVQFLGRLSWLKMALALLAWQAWSTYLPDGGAIWHSD
jgi:hypothetical protein